LVVIAIIAVLIGLLIPAVQAVRESGHRAECQNNLRQLVAAVHSFESSNNVMPPYNGIFGPGQDGGYGYWSNYKAPWGSWFLHLLPYVEQGNLYSSVASINQRAGQNYGGWYSSPATGTLVQPAQPAVYDYTGCVWIPPVAGTPGTTTWVQQNNNGYTVWVQVTTGGTPGVPGYWDPPPKLVSPATPDVWDPPDSGPVWGLSDIWADGVHEVTYKVLQCKSDPSYQNDSLVYNYWGATNYLANWNAWGDTQADGSTVYDNGPTQGWWAPPQTFSSITDGLSNTILFGEGYNWCDNLGRIALYSPSYHNFGLTQSLNAGGLDPTTNTPPVPYWAGMPNTLMFQVRPLPLPYAQCPAGADCCSNWMAQTGHISMNVAMTDGSVRTLPRGMSQQTWNHLLLPRDGCTIGDDW
jgi:hypothetical protein